MSSRLDNKMGPSAIDPNNNNIINRSGGASSKTKLNNNLTNIGEQQFHGDEEPQPIVKLMNTKTSYRESMSSDIKQHIRIVKLRQNEANSKLGFSLRGGKESTGSSVGVFVSHVERHSEADRKGLKIGDQLLQVNGLNVDQATYEKVIHLIKQTPRCNDICLKVNNLGRIPFQERNGDPIKWLQVSDLLDSGSGKRMVGQFAGSDDHDGRRKNQDHDDYDNEDDHQNHLHRKEILLGSNGSSSCDEGLESYNGSQRLANSLSASELSEPEQQQQQQLQPQNHQNHQNHQQQSSKISPKSCNFLHAKAKGQLNYSSRHNNCEHDSGVSSTITSFSLDTESTCSSAGSTSSGSSTTSTTSTTTAESSAAVSPSACSLSISSIQSSSATSTGSGSVVSSEYAHHSGSAASKDLHLDELKETLIRVPGGRRTSEPFGCGVVKGPDEWPGIFVQSVKAGSLAERVGLQPGDQLTRADGQLLDQFTFDTAISLIKRLQQQQNELRLQIKKGAALRYLAEQAGCRQLRGRPGASAAAAAPGKPQETEAEPAALKPVVCKRLTTTVGSACLDRQSELEHNDGRVDVDRTTTTLIKLDGSQVKVKPNGVSRIMQLAKDGKQPQPQHQKKVAQISGGSSDNGNNCSGRSQMDNESCREERRSPDVNVELHKWNQAKAEEACKSRQPAASQIADLARKSPKLVKEKQREFLHKQQTKDSSSRAKLLARVEEKGQVKRRDANWDDDDEDDTVGDSDQDNGNDGRGGGGGSSDSDSSQQEEEEIKIVSQNCKLHYNHQSMQNYKQNLAMDKFKQSATQVDRLQQQQQQQQQQQRQQQPERPEPPKARRRGQVGEEKRRRQLLIDERMSRCSHVPVAQPAACGLQRYVSMDCLPVLSSNKTGSHQLQEQQQQRRLRSSSATRHHQRHPMAIQHEHELQQQRQPACTGLPVAEPRYRMYQRSSSVLGHRMQPTLCCNPTSSIRCQSQEPNGRCSQASAAGASSDCARALASRAITKCCNFHRGESQAAHTRARYCSSTLDSPMPLSRSKAHSMDKLNMNINLNYVKIGLANSYRALHTSSPRLIQHQIPAATSQHQQQQFYDYPSNHHHHLQHQQHQRRLLLAPCADELCCSRLACSPLLQQQQRRPPITRYNYTATTTNAIGYLNSGGISRSGKIRQQIAPTCCQIELMKVSPYCTAQSKQQLRAEALLGSQTLGQHQQAQAQVHGAASACCQLAAGHSCRPVLIANGASYGCKPLDRRELGARAARPAMITRADESLRQQQQHNSYELAAHMTVDHLESTPTGLYHHHQHASRMSPGERRVMSQQVRCRMSQQLKMVPKVNPRQPPVPPPPPPMVLTTNNNNDSASGSSTTESSTRPFTSPRDTRQRLTTFLSVPAGRSCTSDSTVLRGPTVVGCGESPSQESSCSNSTGSEDVLGATMLLSHRQCRSSPAPISPLTPRNQVAVPCPPPPPVPDAEFDGRINSMTGMHDFERISHAGQQTKSESIQQVAITQQQLQQRFRAQKQPLEVGAIEPAQLGLSGSKQNRLCFVDELKMLADRQQQEQQKQLSAEGPTTQMNPLEPSTTLIKIINASKSAHRAATAATVATSAGCGCQTNNRQLDSDKCKQLREKCQSCPTESGSSRTQEAARCTSKSGCTSHRFKATLQESKSSLKLQDQDSKRRQHEMLMKEFKSAHSKMFSKRNRDANLRLDHEEEKVEEELDNQEKLEAQVKTKTRKQVIFGNNNNNNGDKHYNGEARRQLEFIKEIEPINRSSCSSPEVTPKRTTIKTINTKKMGLLTQSSPLHVAAAN